MELKKVEIENFKSIESVNLDLNKDCKILVGLSESGKTNLLTALNGLSGNIKFDRTYIKEGIKSTDESYIDFSFKLNEDEKKMVLKELLSKSKIKDINKIIIIKDKYISLSEFINFNFVYRINIRDNSKKYLHYSFNKKDYMIDSNLSYLSSQNGSSTITNSTTNESISLNDDLFVETEKYNFEPSLEIKDIKNIYDSLEKQIIKIIENNFSLPKVLFWEYSDTYLMPSELNIDNFVNNPDSCIPLKNIFELSGISNIKEEYLEKKDMGDSSFQNLLNKISKNANNYLKKIWKSMPKETELQLLEVGEMLKIRIKDSDNSYLISKRSDGFKRLITFMIMLSINNKNEQLKNTLIIIDEPDTKIDIPGQEYLKNELINIGKNNYVIYSTHSTNMIDNDNLGRHIIVKKDLESTSIETANDDNYMDVATLYRALGNNVYSVINEYNFVFEGWEDKIVYELFIPTNKKLKHVGITHLSGITKAKLYAQFWSLLSRKYFIISDADASALQMKDDFLDNRYSGTWLTYNDLCNKSILTLEDFVKPEYIKKIADTFGKEQGFINEINYKNLESNEEKNIQVIETWIKSNNNSSNSKKIVKSFKEKLYDKIKKQNITDDYQEVINNLLSKISV